MFKSNKGFTLVELIVVIAILAILAGIAIPAYSGYITKAKDAAVLTELDAVKTASFAVNATSATPVTTIEVGTDGTVKINDKAVDLDPYYTDEDLEDLASKLAGTSYANGAVWNATAAAGTEAGWIGIAKAGS